MAQIDHDTVTRVLNDNDIAEIQCMSASHSTIFARNIEKAVIKKMQTVIDALKTERENDVLEKAKDAISLAVLDKAKNEINFADNERKQVIEAFHVTVDAARRAGWIVLSKAPETADEFVAVAKAVSEQIDTFAKKAKQNEKPLAGFINHVENHLKEYKPLFESNDRDVLFGVLETMQHYIDRMRREIKVVSDALETGLTNNPHDGFQVFAMRKILELKAKASEKTNLGGVIFEQRPNTINIQGYSASGALIGMSTRSTVDVHHDMHLIDAILMFDNAVDRGVTFKPHKVGNVFISSGPNKTTSAQAAVVRYVIKGAAPSSDKLSLIKSILIEEYPYSPTQEDRKLFDAQWLTNAMYSMYMMGCADGYDDCRTEMDLGLGHHSV